MAGNRLDAVNGGYLSIRLTRSIWQLRLLFSLSSYY